MNVEDLIHEDVLSLLIVEHLEHADAKKTNVFAILFHLFSSLQELFLDLFLEIYLTNVFQRRRQQLPKQLILQ